MVAPCRAPTVFTSARLRLFTAHAIQPNYQLGEFDGDNQSGRSTRLFVARLRSEGNRQRVVSGGFYGASIARCIFREKEKFAREIPKRLSEAKVQIARSL